MVILRRFVIRVLYSSERDRSDCELQAMAAHSNEATDGGICNSQIKQIKSDTTVANEDAREK
jgi:hypothetical protein